MIWFVNFRLANGIWCSLSSYLGAISTNLFLCSCWLRKDLWVLGNCHVESLLSNQCMTNGWLRQKLNTTYLHSCQFFMKSDKLCRPFVSATNGLNCSLLCVISTFQLGAMRNLNRPTVLSILTIDFRLTDGPDVHNIIPLSKLFGGIKAPPHSISTLLSYPSHIFA